MIVCSHKNVWSLQYYGKNLKRPANLVYGIDKFSFFFVYSLIFLIIFYQFENFEGIIGFSLQSYLQSL